MVFRIAGAIFIQIAGGNARRAIGLIGSGDINRRHNFHAVGNKCKNMALGNPAHLCPEEVVAVKRLVNIKGNGSVFDLFSHMPFEQVRETRVGLIVSLAQFMQASRRKLGRVVLPIR